MNGRRIKATVTGSLLGTLLAGLAVAGESAAPAADAQAQRNALIAAFFAHMDKNKDEQVTRLEAELASKSAFAKLDANGDGELTKAEVEESARNTHQKELAAHFQSLDTDRDGKVSLAEWKLPAPLFERLDANSDKSVTAEEFQAVPLPPTTREQQEFERTDLNHDGKVTREESGRSAKERFDNIDTNKDNLITRAEVEARVDAAMKGGATSAARPAPAK